jgi:hypothetical protein
MDRFSKIRMLGGDCEKWESKKTTAPAEELDVTVRMDAVQMAGSAFWKEAFDQLSAYRRAYDYKLPGDPSKRGYDRVRQYASKDSGTKIGISYSPAHRWLPECIVTISPDDEEGLRRPVLEEVLEILPDRRFLKIEVAHDFHLDSVVNSRFARKHLLMGKSHARKDPQFPNMLWFGARTSPVCGRAYWKPVIKSYRIEVEYHREWLKKYGIVRMNDFLKLPELTCRHHIAFYKLDCLRLSATLARLQLPVESTLRNVISREGDLSGMLEYLRHKVGIVNTQRLLIPLATNSRVERALNQWARQWREDQSKDEVA